MQINTLSVAKKPERKRVGRGGRRGKTAGRGTKGQKARSGASIDPLFEGGRSSLVERLKKVKGFKSPRPKRVALTLGFLERHFSAGEEVSRETILGKKLFSPKHVEGGFKVVGSGELSKALTFDSRIRFSDTALEAVKKAGGTVKED
ncbi:MAG: 50S ribosomal protein L15 [Candidatus Moranbacteria bacterium]|nr:50S ribosomal protein L15 [Candidatus Moranbacteria bacterium]NTW46152.1 50S ribosomal protein L15 [Candidatus Moranbacteria bacterium]